MHRTRTADVEPHHYKITKLHNHTHVMTTKKVYPAPGESVAGTFYVGEIETTYQQIVDTFGASHDLLDHGKTDAEWILMTPDGVATLYNWKDGHAYLGDEGTDVEDITNWHIGGRSKAVVDHVREALIPHEMRANELLREAYRAGKEDEYIGQEILNCAMQWLEEQSIPEEIDGDEVRNALLDAYVRGVCESQ